MFYVEERKTLYPRNWIIKHMKRCLSYIIKNTENSHQEFSISKQIQTNLNEEVERSLGRPQTFDDIVNSIPEAGERCPRASICRLIRHLKSPYTAVCCTLRFTLKKELYHEQLMHHLEKKYYLARMAMWSDHLEGIKNDSLLHLFLERYKVILTYVYQHTVTTAWYGPTKNSHEVREW